MDKPLAEVFRETLSDGSDVFNVRIYDDTTMVIMEVHAISEASAYAIAASVNTAVSAYIVAEWDN